MKMAEQQHTRRLWWRRLLAAVLVVGVTVVATRGIFVITKMQEAAAVLGEYENDLHAWGIVMETLAEHVRESGVWPNDWSDLESRKCSGWPLFDWPADAQEVKDRVSIQFGISLEDVFVENPEEFTAASLVGQTYESHRISGVEHVLEAVAEALEKR